MSYINSNAWRPTAEQETAAYPWSFKNLAKRLKSGKETEHFETLKASAEYISVKEALNSTALVDYIPLLFTEEIVLVGLNEAVARNTFTVIPQSDGYQFRYRYKTRSAGAQIVGEEDEIKQTKSEREWQESRFAKLCDWPYFSWELLSDSPLNELQDDLAMAVSKVYRRENQLMSHCLHSASQSSMADRWLNTIEIDSQEYGELAALKEGMRKAYVQATTRLQDRIDPSLLRWVMGPQTFAVLAADTEIRQWSILGTRPYQTTGEYPTPYGLPMTIMESGYFDTDNAFQSSDDVFLIAPAQCAAIRERVSMRTEPFSEVRNQTTGPVVWERLMPYVRRPHYMYRITPSVELLGIQTKPENIRIGPVSDGTPPLA